jgi:hypothetical protein
MACFTVIIQDPRTFQIGSVVAYHNEAAAVTDYLAAVLDAERPIVHFYYTERPGEPALRLVPTGRDWSRLCQR